jgi:hypothetical protein
VALVPKMRSVAGLSVVRRSLIYPVNADLVVFRIVSQSITDAIYQTPFF